MLEAAIVGVGDNERGHRAGRAHCRVSVRCWAVITAEIGDVIPVAAPAWLCSLAGLTPTALVQSQGQPQVHLQDDMYEWNGSTVDGRCAMAVTGGWALVGVSWRSSTSA